MATWSTIDDNFFRDDSLKEKNGDIDFGKDSFLHVPSQEQVLFVSLRQLFSSTKVRRKRAEIYSKHAGSTSILSLRQLLSNFAQAQYGVCFTKSLEFVVKIDKQKT